MDQEAEKEKKFIEEISFQPRKEFEMKSKLLLKKAFNFVNILIYDYFNLNSNCYSESIAFHVKYVQSSKYILGNIIKLIH